MRRKSPDSYAVGDEFIAVEIEILADIFQQSFLILEGRGTWQQIWNNVVREGLFFALNNNDL